MDNIYSILFWTLLALVLMTAVLLPRNGLLARWRTNRRKNKKQLLEDGLKLIFNSQQEGQPADKYKLAVELEINIKEAQNLIESLEAQQLTVVDKGYLSLTPEGQKWALQVIRAHRLWEKYLADEARMPLEKIHQAAHLHEHRMTTEEIDTLDAELGHPVRDPHGDPIPNAAGVLRDIPSDLSLLEVEAGQRCRITHLEDEPPLAFSQLLAEGINVGQNVIVQENSPERIVLISKDEQYTLSRSIAKNVFIQMEDHEEAVDRGTIPLFNLPNNKKAKIVKIDERCQGFTRRRFLDLGLTPGTEIFPELENAFTDPRAYRVRGTLIALRRDQAALILVRPI
jgi:DtxR family transcriptional regulator, Mn-dependent transcriptional regulator